MNLREFYKACESHDWFYMMSDDPEVYARGQSREIELRNDAIRFGPLGLELFQAFSAHHFSGPAWNKPKAPTPPRPEEEPK